MLLCCFFAPTIQAESDYFESLIELPLEELLEIVVTPSKRSQNVVDSPGIISVLSRDEFSLLPVRNLGELLEFLPNTFMQSSFFVRNGQIGVRGDVSSHYNKHVLILLDGRPIRESLLAGLDTSIFYAFPLSAIEKIEFIRGPGSVLYGTGAYFGTINIISNTSNMHEAKLSAGSLDTYGGTYGIQATNESGNKGVHFYTNQSNGWDLTATDNTGITQTIGVKTESYGMKVNYSEEDLQSNLLLTKTRTPYIGRGNVWENSTTLDTWRVFSDVGYELNWSDVFSSKINFTYNQMGLDDYSDGGQYFQARSDDYLLELANDWRLANGISILAGAEAERKTGGWRSAQNIVVPSYSEECYRLYLEAHYHWHPKLGLTIGLQGNKSPALNWNISPRVGLNIRIDETQGIKFSYAEAYRTASAQERFVNQPGKNLGNPSLKPETIASIDVQYYFRKNHWISAATIFSAKEKELIGRAPVNINGDTINQQQNLGESTTHGLELELQLSQRDVFLLSSITYATISFPQDEVDSKHTPELMAKFSMAYRFNDEYDISFSDHYVAAADEINGGQPNDAVEDVHLLKLMLRYKMNKLFRGTLGKNSTLKLVGNNVLDEDVNAPEIIFETVNATPARAGAMYYLELSTEL